MDALLIDVAHSNPAFRKEALVELHKRAAGFLPPAALSALYKAATAETDPEARRLAELGFLTQLWRFHDFRRALPLVERASEAERAALVATPKPAEKAAPKLAPIVARALDDAADRLLAMRLLEPLKRFGADVGFATVKLVDYLDDPAVRAAAAEVLRRLSPPLGELRERFVALTERDDAAARAIGAGFVTRIALVERDATVMMRLVRHDDATVREYAVGELHAAARANVDIGVAIEALGVALSDPRGGVVYHALRALFAASTTGTALDAALAGLTRLLRQEQYSLEGWAAPLGALERAQVERASPATDAIQTLLHHHLARGDAAAIEALLARDDLPETALLAAAEIVGGQDPGV